MHHDVYIYIYTHRVHYTDSHSPTSDNTGSGVFFTWLTSRLGVWTLLWSFSIPLSNSHGLSPTFGRINDGFIIPEVVRHFDVLCKSDGSVSSVCSVDGIANDGAHMIFRRWMSQVHISINTSQRLFLDFQFLSDWKGWLDHPTSFRNKSPQIGTSDGWQGVVKMGLETSRGLGVCLSGLGLALLSSWGQKDVWCLALMSSCW